MIWNIDTEKNVNYMQEILKNIHRNKVKMKKRIIYYYYFHISLFTFAYLLFYFFLFIFPIFYLSFNFKII